MWCMSRFFTFVKLAIALINEPGVLTVGMPLHFAPIYSCCIACTIIDSFIKKSNLSDTLFITIFGKYFCI